MPEVTVSPKYQIVIPKEVRVRLKLKPGQKLQVVEMKGSIRLIAVPTISALRGIAKGLKWKDDYRDRNDRF